MKKLCLFFLLFVATSYSQERKIKAGDAIEIVVYGHQELSRVVTVNSSGAIDFPFMQNLPVDGLSLEKLREIIVAQLSRYLDSFPVVTLSFAKSNTISVNVMGMVRQPGILQLPLHSNLQAALAAAGGLVPGARANEVSVMHEENGKTNTEKYDLEKFVQAGDLQQNPGLSEGDVVLVVGATSLGAIKVIGEVRLPGMFEEVAGATVFDMILRAGGPTENADIKKIRYISLTGKKSFEISIDIHQYLRAIDTYTMPMVKPGDIIYVPKKVKVWSTILSLARDVSTIAITAWYILQLENN